MIRPHCPVVILPKRRSVYCVAVTGRFMMGPGNVIQCIERLIAQEDCTPFHGSKA
jgi:hypothetical protein